MPTLDPWPSDALVAGYPAEVQPNRAGDPPTVSLSLSGATLVRYRGGGRDWLLRGWPVEVDGEHVARVHAWLGVVRGSSELAHPVADNSARTARRFDGRWWQVEPWMAGDAVRSPSPERLCAAIWLLGRLHEAWRPQACVGMSPGLSTRRRRLIQLAEGGLDRLAGRLTGALDTPERELGLTWVRLTRGRLTGLIARIEGEARTPRALQPCLRDCRPEHFLFKGNRVSGLVDFGAMGVDMVAFDMARLLGEWFAEGVEPATWEAARAAYTEASGSRAPSAGLVSLLDEASSLLIGESWVRWHFEESRRFAEPGAVASGLSKSLERMERRGPLVG